MMHVRKTILGLGDQTFHTVGGLGLIALGIWLAKLGLPATVCVALGIGGGFALGGVVIDKVRGLGL